MSAQIEVTKDRFYQILEDVKRLHNRTPLRYFRERSYPYRAPKVIDWVLPGGPVVGTWIEANWNERRFQDTYLINEEYANL